MRSNGYVVALVFIFLVIKNSDMLHFPFNPLDILFAQSHFSVGLSFIVYL